MVSFQEIANKQTAIAVLGMGYVGLPLAVQLGKSVKVIGFDINPKRVELLKNNIDPSQELSEEELKATQIEYTADPFLLRSAQFIIIAVPTPIDSANNPDLTPVVKAAKTIAQNLQKGSIVVLESTVYPGVTEDVLGPEIEKISGLKQGKDFHLGYSPERINPGDKEHTLERVVKVVSGENAATLEVVAQVYELVVKAGVHRASSIKVAEAAKVIENTQRDINIALMNELSLIFNRMNIDTKEVLEAASTKWNFLKFSPGLVGGHCIGVDPYYLTHKAKELGYNAEIILAGRRINDSMGQIVGQNTIKALIKSGCKVLGAKVAVLGLTFKENVADIRNTKVIDIIKELQSYGVEVLVSDACADAQEVEHEYGYKLISLKELLKIEALVVATAHSDYAQLSFSGIKNMHADPQKAILVDVKRIFNRVQAQSEGIHYLGL